MKSAHIILPFFAAILSACTAPSGMTAKQYLALTQNSDTKPIKLDGLELRIEIPGREPVVLESKGRVQPGKEVHLSAQREFIYPTKYEPAEVAKSDPARVTPATPTEFKTVLTGPVADLKVEQTAGLLLVKGNLTIVDFQGFSRMGGQLGQPLLDDKGRVITENRIEMPKFATFQTPVYLAVKPGETAKINISHGAKGAKAALTLKPGS